ncbi:AraC family transcriptional regulator [Horticoccus luteus]|uniref:AraC family transcriptional regulator n=1 Tax=Horticoccus luteus TaxID=2862869 RepID=A0A8F9TUU6_9BACT|nr:AraC family transcriptional regulator [Horticoccus luteus]QYM78411.1 AraC family transcriptional regulator [Horticoccus luteus]
MSLTGFLGGELVSAIGRLSAAHVLGPWAGRRPSEVRPPRKFVPVLYGDDHVHGHAEMCLLMEGSCCFSFGHAAAELQAGDLVVCPAGMPHAESYARRSAGYRLAWWSLHEREPSLHATRYARGEGFVFERQVSLATLPGEARARLGRLRAAAGAKTPPALDGLREAMLTISLALYRRVLESGEAQVDTRAQLVGRAADFVRANSLRSLSLAEVAQAVHVSPNYLTALFRAESGMPLGQFILSERMQLAQERLRRAGATVKGVALELGFADPFSFSRAFKRVTGRTPRGVLAGAAKR